MVHMTVASEPVVGILNTEVATENVGDQIIMESARREVEQVCGHCRYLTFPTHEKISSYGRGLQKGVSYNIACGTNLLHSHMFLVRQWNIGVRDAFALAPTVLLGVGWRSHAKRSTDPYTKWLLRKVLSKDHLHSVRDSYAERKLKDIGINNVVNTGCPTTWRLDQQHCEKIPSQRGEHAVVVLTDYSQSSDLDTHLLNTVVNNYKRVFFWAQGPGDKRYLEALGFADKVEYLQPNLASYARLLSDKSLSLDYVGTRLHGGIYALQHERRSVIVAVDHRAREMGADLSLPVIDRYADPNAIERMILDQFATNVQLPVENIRRWREQFDR